MYSSIWFIALALVALATYALAGWLTDSIWVSIASSIVATRVAYELAMRRFRPSI